MSWIRKIIAGSIIASFVVGCGALLLFNWSALGYKTLSVPTGSMRPTIPPGSLVLMHRVPVTSLKVGDVITYTNPLNMKKTITPRVIKTYQLGGKIPAFITKGDANPSADPPVVGGLVMGKTVWHVPYLGKAMSWSKTWTGIAVLVYLPALLLMTEEVKRMADYLRLLEPYQAVGFRAKQVRHGLSRGLSLGVGMSAALVITGVFAWEPALALLHSNTVALVNNRITVAAVQPKCSANTNNNTHVSVNNSSTQTASSGNATSSGNTNSGSTTSGSASNSNSTSTTVTITNC